MSGNASYFTVYKKKSGLLFLTFSNNTGNSILHYKTEENQHFTKAWRYQHGIFGSGRAKPQEYEWQRSFLQNSSGMSFVSFLFKVLHLL